MILLWSVLASVVVALVRGGNLKRLADIPFRSAWLVLLAFAMQLYLVYGPPGRSGGLLDPKSILHIGSYLLLIAAVWQNRLLPGMALLALGLALNLTVIIANGGLMPITPEVVQRLGHDRRTVEVASGYTVGRAKDVILPREQTHLYPLSDIFVIIIPGFMHNAFSPGDVLVAAGAFVLLQQAMLGSAPWYKNHSTSETEQTSR